MQPDAFADAVVVMVKNALGPVLERLAAIEARQAVLGDVRDKVVLMEAKAALPIVLKPAPVVDLSPLTERLAAVEARQENLGDLRDRVIVIETNASHPAPLPQPTPPHVSVDFSPVLERVAAAEARLQTIGDLRDRVVVIETKSAQPMPAVDLSEVRDRLSTLEAFTAAPHPADPDLKIGDKLESLGTEVNALRERVAVAEMRQLVPGPMGRDGQPGRDGKDGTNGADGLGWDDLNVQQVDERSFAVKCLRGLQVKDLGTLTFPVQIYRGVYLEGKAYDRGDSVTWAGSEWHCNESTTTKPGDGSKSWTLKVKRGRDGRDALGSSPKPTTVVSLK